MRVKWTISDGAQSFEFKDQNLTSLHREWATLATGRVMFSAERVKWDSDPAWPALTWLTICKDGIPWFVGRRMLVQHTGTAVREGLDYELVDPWWDIEDVTFHQPKLTWDQYGLPVYEDVTEYIYNQDPYGNKLHTGQMITEALNWVLTDRSRAHLRAPFQIGTIEPTADVPWRYEQDRKCAEVIREMASHTSNAHAWFAYSSGLPRFHYRLLSSMTSTTIIVPSNYQRHEVKLKQRVDLACEGVVVRYKTVQSSGGGQKAVYQTEQYPTNAGLYGTRRLFHTIDLAAGSATYRQARVRTVPLNIGTVGWWEGHLPEYNSAKNPRVKIASITNVTADDPSVDPETLKRETCDEVPEWTGFTTGQQTFRCKATVNTYADDAQTQLLIPIEVELTVGPITLTNAGASSQDETYSELADFDPAEPKPIDLAKTYFNAINPVGWEGEVVIREREVSTPPPGSLMGKGFVAYEGTLINLAGGRSEWTSMNAVPVGISQDVDSGETRIALGFPAHLSIDMLMEHQRKARHRIENLYYAAERVTGKKTGGALTTGGNPVNNRGGSAIVKMKRLVIDNDTRKIDLNPADLTKDAKFVSKPECDAVTGESAGEKCYLCEKDD